ncbi:TPA: hypothetical protein ACF2D8_005062, partial [Serratia marcescens]
MSNTAFITTLATVAATIFNPALAATADFTASIAASTPHCKITITPENSTISSEYTLTDTDLTTNTPGTYDFPNPTARFLIGTSGACTSL